MINDCKTVFQGKQHTEHIYGAYGVSAVDIRSILFVLKMQCYNFFKPSARCCIAVQEKNVIRVKAGIELFQELVISLHREQRFRNGMKTPSVLV